jgi:hypothetical protein
MMNGRMDQAVQSWSLWDLLAHKLAHKPDPPPAPRPPGTFEPRSGIVYLSDYPPPCGDPYALDALWE